MRRRTEFFASSVADVQDLFEGFFIDDRIWEIIFVSQDEQRDVGKLWFGHQLVQFFFSLLELCLITCIDHKPGNFTENGYYG